MSLATRCPSCTTTFKVVRDQLRISDGWVRCGRCSHVFDATLELHEMPDGPQQPAAASTTAPAPQPAPSVPESTAASQAAEDAEFFDDELDGRAAPPAAEPAPPADAVAEDTATAPQPGAPEPTPAPSFAMPAHGILADALWSDFDANPPEWRPPPSSLPPFPNIDLNLAAPPSPPPPPPPPLPALRLKARALAESASEETETQELAQDRDQVQMQKALRRARIKSAKVAHAKAREERAAEKLAASSMVRQASEPESAESPLPPPSLREDDDADSERLPLFENDGAKRQGTGVWQRPALRRAMWLLSVLAVLLLVLQVLRHERDGIVARQPNLRPAFATLCRWTGCELTALRQIGDIVIEGAAFTREKTGSSDYRLSFTLRNGAAVPLAMPAIELSLLDTQERAVVRRVLMAPDYGAPPVLAARADQAASLPLSLSASEAAALPPIAGYRVEAFYP